MGKGVEDRGTLGQAKPNMKQIYSISKFIVHHVSMRYNYSMMLHYISALLHCLTHFDASSKNWFHISQLMVLHNGFLQRVKFLVSGFRFPVTGSKYLEYISSNRFTSLTLLFFQKVNTLSFLKSYISKVYLLSFFRKVGAFSR
jgi:hypothetical protein